MDDTERQAEQHAMDAATTALLIRAQEAGRYEAVMDEATPADRALIEAAVERHSARRREAGQPGW